MSVTTGESLAPPGALRPAQLGIVLAGRVALNHIGATVVDLASRGVLSMAIADGSEWQLTAMDAEPQDLPDYERALLAGLFGGQAVIGVEHLTLWMVPALEKVRAEIVRDAIGRGWLRPGLLRRLAVTKQQRRRRDQNPGRRTKPGGELLKEIKAFRRELRVLVSAGDTQTLTRLAPYAMIFGLAAPIPLDSAPAEFREIADPRAQTNAFAARWLEACGGTAGTAGQPAWWYPILDGGPDHLPSHGHGGHAGYDSGHGGGFHGGGHAGSGGGHGG